MSPTMQNLFLGFHLFGAILWIAGLLGLAMALGASRNETAEEARGRLGTLARRLGIFADAGATLAILFGLHRLFSMKLYALPYMQIKIALVVLLIVVHALLRVRARKVSTGQALGGLPMGMPLLLGLTLAIVTVVMLRLPLAW
jgi:uncharacterized membrane protein